MVLSSVVSGNEGSEKHRTLFNLMQGSFDFYATLIKSNLPHAVDARKLNLFDFKSNMRCNLCKNVHELKTATPAGGLRRA